MPLALKNSSTHYGLVSQFFHWLMALLIFMQFIWAWRIEQLGLGRARYELVNEHKSIGITIFMLVIMRLWWRLLNAPPALPQQLSYWQRQTSRWLHRIIYLLLILIPLVGWTMSSAAGFVVSWFDVFDLPAMLAQDDALKQRLLVVHASLAWLLALLVTVHILAALHHHFIKKDDVLRRMLPGKQP